MTKQQSEGEVHVEAMRLILAAMERREDPPDWTILTHMLGMLDTIFQGIEDQRRDDQDELFHTRRNREPRRAEIEALRKQLADSHTVDFNLRRQLDAAQAALTRERLDAEERARELERLRAFVGKVREPRQRRRDETDFQSIPSAYCNRALDDLGTPEPTPVAEPLDAEGGA